MDKKLGTFFIITTAFLFSLISSPIFAQVKTQEGGLSPNFLGQNHYYSVTFRGNGEAIVSLKVVLSNLQEEPLSTINLRVPKVQPGDIAVYQVIREPQCLRYAQEKQEILQENLIQPSEPKIYPLPPRPAPKCEEYQDPDYFQYWYGESKYQKAKYEIRGDTIILTLPNEIKTNSSSSFVVYYRALGYAKKNLFGAFNFAFETLKAEDKIRNLQVGINTDSDLFLQGAGGKVNYRFDESALAGLKSSPMTEAVKNPQFDSFYQQIGQGSITKTASNLQPLESFTVKGSYADSYLKLYGKGLLIGLLIITLFFILIFKLIKHLLKNFTGKVRENKPLEKEKREKDSRTLSVLGSFGLSFASSFLILAYTFFVFFILSHLNNYLDFYQLNGFLAIVTIIISIGVYALLFFGPAIFIGVKKGIGLGVSTLVLTILWLVFYIIVIFVILFLLFQSRQYPTLNYPTSESGTKIENQSVSNP